MEIKSFGKTSEGLEIPCYEFGKKEDPHVFLLGGVHGDEWEGVCLAEELNMSWLERFPYKLRITSVPRFNLDGVLKGTRKNARNVDLNRNLPTKDWTKKGDNPRYEPGPSPNSEPENKALTAWMEKEKPQMIFSFHSWHPLLNINGDCEDVAKVLEERLGYEIKKDIGYPTPGSLGTYGTEKGVPVLTYEIEENLGLSSITRDHLPAMLKALEYLEKKWMS